MTNNFKRRINEFNRYITKFENIDLDSWTMMYSKPCNNRHDAISLEGLMLSDTTQFRNNPNSHERVTCSFKQINEILLKYFEQ